jgi:hypothetical protein
MKVALHRQQLKSLSHGNSSFSVDTIRRFQLADGIHEAMVTTRDMNLHPGGADSSHFCGIGE